MYKKTLATAAAILLAGSAPAVMAQTAQAEPVTMQEAIEIAMQSNPEILQAQYNKEAIEFERRQAQGLFLP
ncbi:MAG: agglutination protein, partial [Erythrobacter sp.]|nr:agglutination protein [Erythrobacter sp.]